MIALVQVGNWSMALGEIARARRNLFEMPELGGTIHQNDAFLLNVVVVVVSQAL